MAELSEIERIVGEAEQATSAGDHAKAERALRRVLRLQEAGLGLSHPDVANTLNDLAVVCDRLGRPDEAEFLYRRALGIARRTLEPDHPYIATSLENLSNLYRAQGKPEKLEKIREGRCRRSKVMKPRIKTLHQETARVLRCISVRYDLKLSWGRPPQCFGIETGAGWRRPDWTRVKP